MQNDAISYGKLATSQRTSSRMPPRSLSLSMPGSASAPTTPSSDSPHNLSIHQAYTNYLSAVTKMEEARQNLLCVLSDEACETFRACNMLTSLSGVPTPTCRNQPDCDTTTLVPHPTQQYLTTDSTPVNCSLSGVRHTPMMPPHPDMTTFPSGGAFHFIAQQSGSLTQSAQTAFLQNTMGVRPQTYWMLQPTLATEADVPPADPLEPQSEVQVNVNESEQVAIAQQSQPSPLSSLSGNKSQEHVCYNPNCWRQGKPFKRFHDFKKHLRVHAGNKPFECGVTGCDKKFADASACRRHEETHKPISERFRCQPCNITFVTKTGYDKHFKRCTKLQIKLVNMKAKSEKFQRSLAEISRQRQLQRSKSTADELVISVSK